jgi:hypothetical protein
MSDSILIKKVFDLFKLLLFISRSGKNGREKNRSNQ